MLGEILWLKLPFKIIEFFSYISESVQSCAMTLDVCFLYLPKLRSIIDDATERHKTANLFGKSRNQETCSF